MKYETWREIKGLDYNWVRFYVLFCYTTAEGKKIFHLPPRIPRIRSQNEKWKIYIWYRKYPSWFVTRSKKKKNGEKTCKLARFCMENLRKATGGKKIHSRWKMKRDGGCEKKHWKRKTKEKKNEWKSKSYICIFFFLEKLTK